MVRGDRLLVAALVMAGALAGCGEAKYPLVTSLGDLRSERRISESEAFYFQEIITLDGSNPSQIVGRPLHYGSPYIGLPSQFIGAILHAIFPLWDSDDLNPSTAFPLEHLVDGVYEEEISKFKKKKEEGLRAEYRDKQKAAESDPRLDDASKKKEAKDKLEKELNKKLEEVRKQVPADGLKNDSYRRIGWCPSPGGATVRSIARIIDDIQGLTLELVDLRMQLAQAQVNKETADAKKALRASIEKKRTAIRDERKKIHDLLTGTDQKGEKVEMAAGVDAGVMIVRWAASEEGGLSVDAGEGFGSGAIQGARRRSGYVILGGLEVSQLVIGQDLLEDLRRMFNGEGISFKVIMDLLKKERLGLTTFTLKAKDIAYASDRQAEFAARLKAVLSKSQLSGATKLDTITIEAEYAQAADLSNIGVLPALQWKIEPYRFGERVLTKDLDSVDPSQRLHFLSPEVEPAAGGEDLRKIGGFSTIYSVVAIPKKRMLKSLKEVERPSKSNTKVESDK